MRRHGLGLGCVAAVLLLTSGCYTPFSPQWARHEIERQTGAPPRDSFEFQLDGATMSLAKLAASRAGGEGGYLAGLTRIDLAVFELPSGGPLDLGRMPQKGWDKILQAREGPFNLLVLARTGGRSLRDLAVFAQGENQLLYGRQKGSLAPDLPSTLQSVLQTAGLAGLKEHLLSAAQDSQPPPSP